MKRVAEQEHQPKVTWLVIYRTLLGLMMSIVTGVVLFIASNLKDLYDFKLKTEPRINSVETRVDNLEHYVYPPRSEYGATAEKLKATAQKLQEKQCP